MKNPHRALLAFLVAAVGVLAAVGGIGRAAATVAPVNTGPPAITGTATVGQTLSASDGTWSNAPTSFSYQWLRCNGGGNSCASIPGATGKTYVLTAADVGQTLRVRVTATNADGSASAQSDQTAAVSPATSNAVPKNTAPPAVTGIAKVGQTLAASPGTWSGNPTSYTYQWQHCNIDTTSGCSNISGATSSTYALHVADLGYRLRVQVTAKNAKGTATAVSAPTAVVAPAVRLTNQRPTLTIISMRFLGAAVYARFRVCDDSMKNVTIIETDSRPGKLSYTRRFTTLTPPRPCGVYTRHWTPAARFRGPGRFTVTLRARDKSGFTSLAAHRTFSHG